MRTKTDIEFDVAKTTGEKQLEVLLDIRETLNKLLDKQKNDRKK